MSIMQRNQEATYWAPTGTQAWNQPTFAAPAKIMVRWQGKQQLIRNKEGREVVAEAAVYTGQEIALSGRLQLGVHTGAPTTEAKEPQAVSPLVTVGGAVDHWKVFL